MIEYAGGAVTVSRLEETVEISLICFVSPPEPWTCIVLAVMPLSTVGAWSAAMAEAVNLPPEPPESWPASRVGPVTVWAAKSFMSVAIFFTRRDQF